MRLHNATHLCAWSLGFLLMWLPSAAAQEMPPSAALVSCSSNVLLNDLAEADVVYLGETHDRPADHAAQLQIIQALQARNPNLAIGMEMFQRPFQGVMDQYLGAAISETELQQQSEYDQRWGFPWEYYAPILRFARAHRLPVLALNTPAEITQQVAEKGLASLTDADRQWIPPLSEIRTDNAAYRKFLAELFKEIHQHHGSSEGFENFFLAQVLWDETMAEGVAEFWREHPDHQVVVLAGQGHIMYGYGIPSRVARRLENDPDFEQRLVLLNPAEAVQADESGAIADHLCVTETPSD